MEGINTVSISGRASRDPELRGSGAASLLAFTVCVNDRRKDENGNWGDVPNFIDCVVFGSRAETLADMLHKGDEVFIQGKLRQNTWEKDGQKRSKTEVKAEKLFFYPKRQKDIEVEPFDVPF